MEKIDVAEWPLIARGTRFTEHVVGRTFDHHWGRTVHASDNIGFSTSTLAFNPVYFNRQQALEAGHSDELVNPMLTFSIVFGLSVEDLSEAGGAFLGTEELEFLAPVYPGDTLYARSTVVAARSSQSRPDDGIVTWRTIGFNQDGVEVITFQRTNLVSGIPEPDSVAPLEGWFEDFHPGDKMRHARSKTVTDVELAYFTLLVMNSAQGHFSEAAMASTEFGQRINFGGLSLSLTIGLATQDTTAQAIREIGLTSVRFAVPVTCGDTLSTVTEVVTSTPVDADTGEVVFRHLGVNQEHAVVCQAERRVLLRRLPIS